MTMAGLPRLIPIGITEGPKRDQCKSGEFDVLFGKRYPDDGNGRQDSENDVDDRDVKSAKNDPQDIEEEVKAAVACPFIIQGLSERCKGKDSQSEQLNAEGDADDGQADQQSTQEIEKTDEDTPSKDHPKDISDCSHCC